MENAPAQYTKSASDLLLETMGTGSSGDEEILKVASKYALQLTGVQMRGLMLLRLAKNLCNPEDKERIDVFCEEYIKMKEYNGSDMFVMAALREISLKKFISSIGINAIKQL